MDRWAAHWGDRLRIQHKVWAVFLLLCVPLSAGIAVHLYIVKQLLSLQQQRQELMVADAQVHVLGRLAVDIEDGFRGYVLTQQPAFLAPLTDAESKLSQALSDATQALARLSDSPGDLALIERQLKDLLRSKHELIADIQKGPADRALAYVRSGEGLRLSDLLREGVRDIEDRLEKQRNSLNEQADALSNQTFVGLWVTLAAVVALGWIVSRVLARSLTEPITRLQSATARIGAHVDVAGITELLATSRVAKDELGQLAEAYLAMARRIETGIQEIQALDINESAQQKQRGLVTRLRQLEHLAETLAHDLKGPGARMEELARLLVQQDGGNFDDRTKRWLSLIEENGRDLVQRVEGILTVANVGADQETITAIDPTSTIAEVLNARADEIGRLRAVVHVEPGLPLVACHGHNLRQIFDNLISNALKFTREGESPVVRVTGRRLQGPFVAFSVEDCGIGVPSSQRTRVFQPFVRLLMSEAPGNGIGLTIIARIVELYGGKIWIEGAEGQGCTVRFTIPSVQSPTGTAKAPDVVDSIRREVL